MQLADENIGKLDEISEIRILRAIERGLSNLSEAINFYWPPKNSKNDNPEDALHFYVSYSLNKIGYYIYPQAPFAEHTKRIDCIAINPDVPSLIVTESKRLYSAEKAGSIAADIDRIKMFDLNEKELAVDIKFQKYGLILATTFHKEIASWWTCDEEEYIAGINEEEVKGWKALYDQWPDNNCTYGRIHLQSYEEGEDYPAGDYYALFLLFRV